MHLVEAGVSLDIIRDFFGHADIKTTELYARANLEMKRAAIEKSVQHPYPMFLHGRRIKHCWSGCSLYRGHRDG